MARRKSLRSQLYRAARLRLTEAVGRERPDLVGDGHRNNAALEGHGEPWRWREDESAQGLPSTLDKQRQFRTGQAHRSTSHTLPAKMTFPSCPTRMTGRSGAPTS